MNENKKTGVHWRITYRKTRESKLSGQKGIGARVRLELALASALIRIWLWPLDVILPPRLLCRRLATTARLCVESLRNQPFLFLDIWQEEIMRFFDCSATPEHKSMSFERIAFNITTLSLFIIATVCSYLRMGERANGHLISAVER